MALEENLKQESVLKKEKSLPKEKKITPIKGESVYTGKAGDSRTRIQKLEDDYQFLGGTYDDISKLRKQQDADTRNPVEKALGLRRNQNIIFDVLEIFDRPDNALRASTEWLLEGKNPIEGYAKGVTGEAKVEWHDILNIDAENDPGLAVVVDVGMTILSVVTMAIALKAVGSTLAVGAVAGGAVAGKATKAAKLSGFQKIAKTSVEALEQHSRFGITATKGLFKVSFKGASKTLNFAVINSPVSKAIQRNFPNLSKNISSLAGRMNAFIKNMKSKWAKNPNFADWNRLDKQAQKTLNNLVQEHAKIQEALWTKVSAQTLEGGNFRKAVYRFLPDSIKPQWTEAFDNYFNVMKTPGSLKKWNKTASAAEKKARFLFSNGLSSAQYRFIEAINAKQFPQKASIKGVNLMFDLGLFSGIKNSQFYSNVVSGGYHSFTYTISPTELKKIPFFKKLQALAEAKFPKDKTSQKTIKDTFKKAISEGSSQPEELNVVVKRLLPYSKPNDKLLGAKVSLREDASQKISNALQEIVDWNKGTFKIGKTIDDIDQPIIKILSEQSEAIDDIFPAYFTLRRKEKTIKSIIDRIKLSIKQEFEVATNARLQKHINISNIDKAIDTGLIKNNLLPPITIVKGASGESIVKISDEFQDYLHSLVTQYFPKHSSSGEIDFKFLQLDKNSNSTFDPSAYSKNGVFSDYVKNEIIDNRPNIFSNLTSSVDKKELRKIKELFETFTDDYQKFSLDTDQAREIEQLVDAINSSPNKLGSDVIEGADWLDDTEKAVASFIEEGANSALHLQKRSVALYSQYLEDLGLDPYDESYVLSGYFKRVVNPDALTQLSYDTPQQYQKALMSGQITKGVSIGAFSPRIYNNSLYTSDINEIIGYSLGEAKFGLNTPLFGEVPFNSVVSQLGDLMKDAKGSSIDLLLVKKTPYNKIDFSQNIQKNISKKLKGKTRAVSRFEKNINTWQKKINDIGETLNAGQTNLQTIQKIVDKKWIAFKTRITSTIKNIKRTNKAIKTSLQDLKVSNLTKSLESDLSSFYTKGVKVVKDDLVKAKDITSKAVNSDDFGGWVTDFMKKSEDYEGLSQNVIKDIRLGIEEGFADPKKIFIDTIEDDKGVSYVITPYSQSTLDDFVGIKDLGWDRKTFNDWFNEVKKIKDKRLKYDIIKTLYRSNGGKKLLILDPKTGLIQGTITMEKQVSKALSIPSKKQLQVYMDYRKKLERKVQLRITKLGEPLNDDVVKLKLLNDMIQAKVNSDFVTFANKFSKLDFKDAWRRIQNPDIYADGDFIKVLTSKKFKSKTLLNEISEVIKKDTKQAAKIEDGINKIKELQEKIAKTDLEKNISIIEKNKIQNKLDKLVKNPKLDINQRRLVDDFQRQMASQYPDDFAVRLSANEIKTAKRKYQEVTHSPKWAAYTGVDATKYLEKRQGHLIYSGLKKGLAGDYSDTAKETITFGLMQELNKLKSADGKIYIHNSIVNDVVRTIDQEKANNYLGRFMDEFNSIIMKPWKKITLTGAAPVIRSWFTNGLRAYTDVGINPVRFIRQVKVKAKEHSLFKNLIEKVFNSPDFLKKFKAQHKNIPLGKYLDRELDVLRKEIVKVARKDFKMPAAKAETLLNNYVRYAKQNLFGQTVMTQDAITMTKATSGVMAAAKDKDLGQGITKKISDIANWSLKQYGKSDEISKMVISDIVSKDVLIQQEQLTKPWNRAIALNPDLSEVEKVEKLAGRVANWSLFNFSNLSEFERTTLRRWTIFSIWGLKNLQTRALSLMQNTRRHVRVYRFFKQWNEGFASMYKQSYDPDRDKLPRWAQERENLILPWKLGYLNMSPTVVSAAQFGQSFGLSTLHPLLKSVIQGATGLDFYKQSPLRDPSMTGGFIPNMFSPFVRKAEYGIDLTKKLFGGEEDRSALDVMSGNLIKSVDEKKRQEQIEKAYIQKLLKENRQKRINKGWIPDPNE